MVKPEEERVLYALYPGHVRSKSDGQVYYVSARMLAVLYGVPFNQCAVFERSGDWHGRWHDGLIPLHPRYDGDYSVATVIQEMSWK